MLGVFVHVVHEAFGGTVARDHQLKEWFVAFHMSPHAAMSPTAGKYVQYQRIWFLIDVEEIVKRGIRKLHGVIIGDVAPEIEILDSEEVEEKLIVVLLPGQELKHLYLLAVLLELPNKLLYIVVLLAILDAEDEAYEVGSLVWRTGAQALVLAQGGLGSPIQKSEFQKGCIWIAKLSEF